MRTGNPQPLEPTPAPPPSQAAPWHPLLRAGLFLAVYVLLQVAVVRALSLPAFLLGERWFRAGGFASSNEIFLLAIVLSAPPTLGATWLFVRFADGRTLASLGARWPAGGPRAALRQLVTVPLGTLVFLAGWLALLLALPAPLAEVRYAGAHRPPPGWWPFPPWMLLALLGLGFLLQAGLEEWVLRGYVYHALKDGWRPWTAALASSLVFALLHGANPEVSLLALFNVLLAGMVLAALVERSGSLWSATLAHATWNFSVACLLSLPVSGVRMAHLLDLRVSGDDRLTGGGFGPEASVLLTLLGLPLAAALWWNRRREGAASAPEDVRRGPPPGEPVV